MNWKHVFNHKRKYRKNHLYYTEKNIKIFFSLGHTYTRYSCVTTGFPSSYQKRHNIVFILFKNYTGRDYEIGGISRSKRDSRGPVWIYAARRRGETIHLNNDSSAFALTRLLHRSLLNYPPQYLCPRDTGEFKFSRETYKVNADKYILALSWNQKSHT